MASHQAHRSVCHGCEECEEDDVDGCGEGERDEGGMTVLNGSGEVSEYHDSVHALGSFKEGCIVRWDMHDWMQGWLGMMERVLSSGWHESVAFCIITVH